MNELAALRKLYEELVPIMDVYKHSLQRSWPPLRSAFDDCSILLNTRETKAIVHVCGPRHQQEDE